MSEVLKEINLLSRRIIRDMKKNLADGGHNTSTNLRKSLSYEIEETKVGYKIKFNGAGYAPFLDQGVQGAEGDQNKAPNSPFHFGARSKGSGKMPPREPLLKWIKRKRIRFREREVKSKRGEFREGTYNQIAYVFQRSIWRKGIKPTMFATKAFEKQLKGFGDRLNKAIDKDSRNGED